MFPTSQEVIGPITSLIRDPACSHVVFGAVGNYLLVLNLYTGKCISKFLVFKNSNIDILYISNNYICCVGDNNIHILQIDFVRNNDTDSNVVVTSHQTYFSLDDRILDCIISNEGYLIVGYAHNFVDIFNFSDNEKQINHCIQRIFAPIPNIVLFSMSFAINSTDGMCSISCGTAMGKILIWSFDISGIGNGSSPNPTVVTLNGHEGVVFKTRWSDNQKYLVSVSDDRTLRLWDVGLQVLCWVGWGHTCRVWDVCFMNVESAFGDNVSHGHMLPLATSSEDGTVRTWLADTTGNQSSGTSLSTFVGHGKNVWRVIFTQLSSTRTVLVSGGNDGTIKLWDVSNMSLCNHTNAILSGCAKTNSTIFSGNSECNRCTDSYVIPEWSPESEEDGVAAPNNRRVNGCSNVYMSPCCRYCIVVVTSGALWLLDLTESSRTIDTKANLNWIALHHYHKSVVYAHVTFIADNVNIFCTHPDGVCSYLNVHYSNKVITNANTCVQWKPHKLRAISGWILGKIKVLHRVHLLVLSTSVKGMCSLSGICDNDIQWTYEFGTSGGHIATSAAAIEIDKSLIVIVGDCRGGLTFHCVDIGCLDIKVGTDTEESILTGKELFYRSRAHHTDPVTCIKTHSLLGYHCVTMGQDGYLHDYEFIRNHHTSKLHVECVSQMSTYPIVFPDQLFVPTTSQGSCVIGGFVGDEYIMWDIDPCSKYQLMRVQGGGWKRPHHCNMEYSAVDGVLRLPRVAFVHCAPMRSGSEVRVVRNFCMNREDAIEKATGNCVNFPYSITNIYPFFGKVGYCCTGVQMKIKNQQMEVESCALSNCFAVGGEEGIVRVYDCHGLVVLQEMQLTGFTPVRALTSSQSAESGCGILIACGGKLTYSIWSFGPNTNTDMNYKTAEFAGGTPFRIEVNAMKTWANASQDHRLLTVSSVAYRMRSSEDACQHLIAMGDSRGVVSIVNYHCGKPSNFNYSDASPVNDYGYHKSCSYLLDSIECSEYPILASSLEVINNQDSLDSQLSIIGLFGDTNGTIFCHLVNVSTENQYETASKTPMWIIQANDAYIASPSSPVLCPPFPILFHTTKLLLSYEGHRQGVNCLSTKLVKDTSTVVVGSGGDDQNICIAEIQVSTQYLKVLSIFRRLGSSGSALKGISLALPCEKTITESESMANSGTVDLVSVGYDRRLQFWRIRLKSTGSDESNGLGCIALNSTVALSSLHISYERIQTNAGTIVDDNVKESDYMEWRHGKMVHIADVGGIHVTNMHGPNVDQTHTYIGVVGEGFEVFSNASV